MKYRKMSTTKICIYIVCISNSLSMYQPTSPWGEIHQSECEALYEQRL